MFSLFTSGATAPEDCMIERMSEAEKAGTHVESRRSLHPGVTFGILAIVLALVGYGVFLGMSDWPVTKSPEQERADTAARSEYHGRVNPAYNRLLTALSAMGPALESGAGIERAMEVEAAADDLRRVAEEPCPDRFRTYHSLLGQLATAATEASQATRHGLERNNNDDLMRAQVKVKDCTELIQQLTEHLND